MKTQDEALKILRENPIFWSRLGFCYDPPLKDENGAYFVTICTKDRKRILSDIVVGEGSPLPFGFPHPKLTDIGKILDNVILSVNEKYPHVTVDKYVIMPDHAHIIFVINNNGRGNPSPTICNVVGWLKYNSTKQINQIKKIILDLLWIFKIYGQKHFKWFLIFLL